MLRESGSASAARASRVAAAAGLPSPSRCETTPVPLVDAALGGVVLRHRAPLPPAGGPSARPAAHRPLRPPRRGPAEQHAPTITRRAHVVGIPVAVAAPGLEVRPFRALTYRQRDPGHLARVSSPAYDLVTPAGRDRLADADPHNIVRLILPRVDRPAAGADRAARARPSRPPHTLAALARRRRPRAGRRSRRCGSTSCSPPDGGSGDRRLARRGRAAAGRVRRGAPARGHLSRRGRGPPRPAGRDRHRPRADRPRPRPRPEVAELTARARQGDPDPGGAGHRRRAAPAVAGDRRRRCWPRLTEALRPHRRRHRRRPPPLRRRPRPLARRAAAGTGSDAILALVTPMGPGGLRVDADPPGRARPRLRRRTWPTARQGFRVTEVPVGDVGPDAVVRGRSHRWLATPAEPGFLRHRRPPARRSSTDPSEAVLAAVPAEAPPAWRGLDVVLAHHGLLARLWQRPDDPESVLIAHSVEEARRGPRATARGVALLLRAPSPGRRRRGRPRRRPDAPEVDAVRAEAADRAGAPARSRTDRPAARRHAVRSAELAGRPRAPSGRGGSSPRRPTRCRCRCARTGAAARPRPRRRRPAARAATRRCSARS